MRGMYIYSMRKPERIDERDVHLQYETERIDERDVHLQYEKV